MFGKPGRPPEDHVARQQQIWTAVSPLIEESGARALTMRQAAAASFLSLGGLYHYFPNKRALVLFGTSQVAIERICKDFEAEHGHLRHSDPQGHVEAFIHFFAKQISFVRPAVGAALELGAGEFRARLLANLNMGLGALVKTLEVAAPDATTSDLRSLEKSLRRLFFASLVDPTVTLGEFEAEMRALIDGVAAKTQARRPLAVVGS